MFKSESLTLDSNKIKDFINKESNPFLKKSRNNFLKKLGEKKFNIKEEYKFTPLKQSLEKKFGLEFKIDKNITSNIEKKILPYIINDNSVYQIITLDGKIIKKFSNIPSKISFKNFEELDKKEKNILHQYFGENDDSDSDVFSALNGVLWSKGLFVYIKKNQIVDNPIIINNFYTPERNIFSSQLRNFIFMEKNSKLSICELDCSLTSNNFNSNVTEIILEERSELDYFKIQNDQNNSTSFNSTNIKQKRNSISNTFTFSFSGDMIRNNLNISLIDENCYCNMYGIYALNNDSHVDNHTSVDHIQKNSISNEHYKGIMNGNSNGVFNGKIFVRKEAQKTNAFQSNNNIILSDNAKINTKPQLEIWADDVKCSHGCTTGQLDENAIFYLQSRGINKDKAVSILINAFFDEIIQKINQNIIKDKIHKILSSKIESYLNEH